MARFAHNHAKLRLEGARAVPAAARRHAEEIYVPMDIPETHEGGHLLGFEWMYGPRPSGQVVGDIGVRAGTQDQDLEVTIAGAAALTNA